MIGTPVKDNYDFAGWTKTQDGTDFVEKYNNESGLVLYAAWESQTSKTKTKTHFDNVWVETSPGTWTDVGCDDNVTLSVDAQSDGLHVTKSNDAIYTRVTFKVHDDTTNTDLMWLDNLDHYDNGDVTLTNEFIYPYVTAGNSYTVTLELQKSNYTYGHSLAMQIKATGGKGDIYITHDGYTFDIDTLTFTFKNLSLDLSAINDDLSNHVTFLFSNAVWGNIIDIEGNGDGWWQRKWALISEESNKVQIQKQIGWNPGKGEFVAFNKTPDQIYAVLRYEYKDSETNLTYLTELLAEKIYTSAN